jgi:anthranilate/para-aminobenzoate synthase component II
MLLTIDIKDSAFDKVMYLLKNLKEDVTIIDNKDTELQIETISKDDKDYKYIEQGRIERKTNPENYGSLDDIKWD